MTPETRETHARVLDDLVQDAATNSYPEMTDARVFACLAGSAALRDVLTPRTCASCKHFLPWFKHGITVSGQPEKRGDCKHRSYLGRRNGQSPEDGCIKGWQAREGEAHEG